MKIKPKLKPHGSVKGFTFDAPNDYPSPIKSFGKGPGSQEENKFMKGLGKPKKGKN